MPKFNDRKSSAERGYGYKWQKARSKYLSENPFCVEHEKLGRQVLATVVDHIIQHNGDHKLFWDRKNWQSLCKICHDSYKHRLEKSGAVVGCDASGLPIDSNHHWRR